MQNLFANKKCHSHFVTKVIINAYTSFVVCSFIFVLEQKFFCKYVLHTFGKYNPYP